MFAPLHSFYKEIQRIHAKKYLPKDTGVQDGQEILAKHTEPICRLR